MWKRLSFFLLAFLLLSTAECRRISSTTWKQLSNSADAPLPSRPPIPAPEVSSMDSDDCSGLGSEECLLRKSLIAHLDYIYTQGTDGP